MEQPKSSKLRNLLISDDEINKKIYKAEESKMAKDLKDLRKKKEEKEAEAKAAQEQKAMEVNEEQKPQEEGGEQKAQEAGDVKESKDMSADERRAEMEKLLEQSKKVVEGSQEDGSGSDKTDLFGNNDGNNEDGEDDLSEEERKKRDEAARKRAERERAAAEHNALVDSALASLEKQVSTTETTPKQREFQKACSAFYTVEGLIVETEPYPEVSIGRRFLKENKEDKLLPTATKEDAQKYLDNPKGSLKKVNIFDHEMYIRYAYKKPGAVVGGVITIPTVLLTTVEGFTNETFNIPTVDEIKNSDKITTVVDFGALYTYALVFCGGKIKENEIVKTGNFEGAKLAGKLIADVVIASKKENGVTSTYERRVFKAKNRSSLLCEQNIIPIKTFGLSQLGKLDSDTRAGLKEAFFKALDKKKDFDFAPATKLDKSASNLIKYELNENKELASLKVAFIDGTQILGVGSTREYTLRHWVNASRNPETKKLEYTEVAGCPTVRYVGHEKTNEPGKFTYKKLAYMLGTDTTLEKLGAKYPAAKIAHDLGIDEQKILDVYANYKAAQKALRDEKARAAGKASATQRKSNVINNSLASRLLLEKLNGTAGIDLGLDTDAIADSIASTTFGA